MLGIAAREVGLPEPVMRVAVPSWVIAETMHLEGGMNLLLCYKSTWLRDGDPHYTEVAELLGRSTVKELYRRTVEDPDMMHGAGEWTGYLLNPIAVPGPRAQLIIDMVAGWGDPIHLTRVPEEVARRLQGMKENVR